MDTPHTAVLSATYYDTEDLRLAREGITLRRREGGDDEGWHLKLPVAGAAAGRGAKGTGVPVERDEIQLRESHSDEPHPDLLPAGRSDAVPQELLDLVTVYVRYAAVVPVATLLTERTTYTLLSSDGTQLAELVDDTVSTLDGSGLDMGREGREAVRFRELELETREGDRTTIDHVTALLVEAGAVDGNGTPKAIRALGRRAGGDPEVPAPGRVTPADPASLAVAAHLATHVRAFRRQDVRVRRDLEDSVHQMRVAARRLRSGLQVFAPLVDSEWAGEIRTELAWIAGELGEVRDREVLLARLERDITRLPGDVDTTGARRLIERRLGGEMAEARKQVLEALRSDRYLALAERLVDAAVHPRTTKRADRPCADVLPPLVSKAWRRLATDVRQLPQGGSPSNPPSSHVTEGSHSNSTEDSTDAQWHKARIAAKKARYAAEACTPVFDRPARDLARQVERVTELLGEHQDAAVAADTIRSLVSTPRVNATTGFVLGLLHSLQREGIRAARHEFGQIWPSVNRKKWRRWLDPD